MKMQILRPRHESPMPQTKGFTIMELMMALAISTLIILAVSKLYISNNQNFRVQEGLARMNEGSAFAMDLISSRLRLAGYRTDLTQEPENAFPAMTVDGVAFQKGQVVYANHGTSAADPAVIYVRMFPDGDTLASGIFDASILDCEGNAHAINTSNLLNPNSIITMRFSVVPNAVVDSASAGITATRAPVLACEYWVGATKSPNGPFYMTSHVHDLQVRFGVDKSATPDKLPDVYVKPSLMTSTNWLNVHSVRVCATMQTRTTKLELKGGSSTYFDCSSAVEDDFSVETAATDTRIHRSYVQAVELRNMAPSEGGVVP